MDSRLLHTVYTYNAVHVDHSGMADRTGFTKAVQLTRLIRPIPRCA